MRCKRGGERRSLPVPIPRPRIAFGPTRLNLHHVPSTLLLHLTKREETLATHIGAFANISGTIKYLTMLPRIYTCSS